MRRPTFVRLASKEIPADAPRRSELRLLGLPDAQVQHDLLAAPRDRVGAHVPVEPLHLLPEAGAGVGVAAKDLPRLARTVLEDLGGVRLGHGDGAAQRRHGLLLGHVAELEREVLQPVVGGLDLPRHLGELPTDHRVLHQLLAEGAALVGIVPGLLKADPAEAVGLDHEAPTLVVKVLHDDPETLVLLADQVGQGHLHLVELHVGGAAGPHALAVHALGGDARHALALQQQHGDAAHARAAGAHGHSEEVREHAVGDPLLVPVHHVVVTLPLGRGPDARNVASGAGLRDVQADDLLPHEAGRGDSLPHLLTAEV
mmetsp:Transcript_75453/g.233414  ORF Transcript_75453/g.233414 Transcript_75453/m.233414 type:complete len:314 (+) Transcript_75453:100-1041(+)